MASPKQLISAFFFIVISLLFFQPAPVFSQTRTIDSVKQLLANEKQDTSRSLLLSQLAREYLNSRPDTSLLLAEQALAIAKSEKFKRGEIIGLMRTANVLDITGNFAKALKVYLDVLKKTEEAGDSSTMGKVISDIGIVSSEQGDFEKYKSFAFQGYTIARNLHDDDGIMASSLNLGDSYISLGKMDSARFYTSLCYNLATRLHNLNHIGLSLSNTGEIYFLSNRMDSAMAYFRKASHYLELAQDENTSCMVWMAMSKLFGQRGMDDSCLYYARFAYSSAVHAHFAQNTLDAAVLLSDYFRQHKEIDSSYSYLQAVISAKDSLFSQEKQRELQSLSFDERMRQQEIQLAKEEARTQVKFDVLIGGIATLLIIAFLLYRNTRHRKQANLSLQQEKQKVEETLHELKSTQAQLIQSEKMASLGELTAGIAHEIQNPLNFVNNFSEVNRELISELVEEVDKGNTEGVKDIANAIKDNSEKINHHGKRADAIVKGMLQHSRKSEGKKEATDINALCDEYLRLAYHGIRAKDNSFNATLKTDFDESIGEINIIPQDIGRVLLNVFNNAFYALGEKGRAERGTLNAERLRQNAERLGQNAEYEPMVSVSTKLIKASSRVGASGISITVSDNGIGIPPNIVDKIFQPFFTTKPTGSGTGLGLSLSYDILRAHNGSITVESKTGEGSVFTIQLPID